MGQEVVISGSFANVHEQVTQEDFFAYLRRVCPDVEIYRLSGATAAAFDWRLCLKDAAAIAGVAGALFAAYDHLIKPTKASGSDAGIFMVVGDPDDKSDHIWIGKNAHDVDLTVTRSVKETKRVLSTKKGKASMTNLVEETRTSLYWVHIRQ